MQLTFLNAADQTSFVAQLGAVFEHSPWIAARAWAQRPFADISSLHAAMMKAVNTATPAEQLALIRAHPELAGSEAAAGGLTADSSSEQARLGFTALSRAELQRMQDLNRQYREKYGFPCVVALRLHTTRESVMNEMQHALGGAESTEVKRALAQIGEIARGRLQKMTEAA